MAPLFFDFKVNFDFIDKSHYIESSIAYKSIQISYKNSHILASFILCVKKS